MKYYNGASSHSSRGTYTSERAINGSWGAHRGDKIVCKNKLMNTKPEGVKSVWKDNSLWMDSLMWGYIKK